MGHLGLAVPSIKLAYLRAIDTAATRINIADPYFSDPDIVQHLCKASRRGVTVSVVLPRTNNHPLEQEGREGTLRQDARCRCTDLRVPNGRPMAHDKVATFDGTVSTIGSSNLDARSLANNDEANVWSTDPAVAQALDRDLFASDLQASDSITEAPSGLIEKVKEEVAWELRDEL